MLRGGLLVATVLLGLEPTAALAASTVTLVMGGEGYDGPPTFAVSFDGKPVGAGTVSGAIDSGEWPSGRSCTGQLLVRAKEAMHAPARAKGA